MLLGCDVGEADTTNFLEQSSREHLGLLGSFDLRSRMAVVVLPNQGLA
jgi:hypothetical protein